MVSLAACDEVSTRREGAGDFVPVLTREFEGGVHGFAAGADEEGFGEPVGRAVLEEEGGKGFGGGGGVGACVDIGDGAELGKGRGEDLAGFWIRQAL